MESDQINQENQNSAGTQETKKAGLNTPFWRRSRPLIFVVVFVLIGGYIIVKDFAATVSQTKVWSTAADWGTGTLSNAAVVGNSVTLAPSNATASPTTATTTTTTPTTNLALNRPAFASSTNTIYTGATLPASYVDDGNLNTRWGSQYSDPQWVYIDLGTTYNINEVKLNWETAYGKAYQIQVSNDAHTWTTIYTTTTGTGGINDLTGLSGSGRYIRMYGTARGTVWGYSLWEMSVYGTPATVTNIALNRPAFASSTNTIYTGATLPASYVDDGNLNTRWGSQYSDPQWVYIDLGTTYNINEVKLNWETAYGKAYQIQVSNDAHTWTTIYTTTTGTGGINDLTGLSGSGRYIRMYGTARGTVWGYSLWEMSVYGTPTGTTTPPPPPTTGYDSTGNITLSYDAGSSVTWTTLTPAVTLPSGTNVTYQARTSTNNSTWSAWTSNISSLAGSRYIQVQADLSTTSGAVTPALNSLTLAYNATVATPTATLSANPTTITSGQSTTLTWSSSNATSCTASGSWSGSQATSGTVSVSPTATSTYNLSCAGAGGNVTATPVTITVNSAVGGGGGSTSCSTTTTSLAIRVCNGQFVTGSNKPIRPIGLDVSGTEDACIQNRGLNWISMDAASASAIAGWHTNIVRVPLNEDCWLGINGSPAAYSGAAYQTAIENWVSTLNAAGLDVILDLHWTAPGSVEATQQWPMADADHSITFWSQVAGDFKNNPSVLFDLFNEPYIGGYAANSSASWNCWLNGCSDSGDAPTSASDYNTAGMQQMVTAIRNAGASNVILLGSLSWAGDTCGGQSSPTSCTMMSYLPTDPDHQLAIDIHSYGDGAAGSSYCDDTTCLGVVKSAATNNALPVVADEIGDTQNTAAYINTFMSWGDSNNVGYLAWAWTPGTGFYDLISDESGTCKQPDGCVFQSHFAQVNP